MERIVISDYELLLAKFIYFSETISGESLSQDVKEGFKNVVEPHIRKIITDEDINTRFMVFHNDSMELKSSDFKKNKGYNLRDDPFHYFKPNLIPEIYSISMCDLFNIMFGLVYEYINEVAWFQAFVYINQFNSFRDMLRLYDSKNENDCRVLELYRQVKEASE